ncbi:MAG: hypothetical protein MUP73_00595 [Dehalococcoidia bacterium]|nr:hypothetical protein [Dehalococcoidia bacterium]
MSDLRAELTDLCDGSLTYRELAVSLGRSHSYICELVREMNLPRPARDLSKSRKSSPENIAILAKIQALANGVLTSREIAVLVGSTQKYVQRMVLKHDLPRLPQAPRAGKHNPSWVGGRAIDLDGYVLVKSPANHPHARAVGSIYEHRLVMEDKLSRYLTPAEVVDHIDSITIHNDARNLRLFANNADHLRATISCQCPQWSQAGFEKLSSTHRLRGDLPVVDTYRLRKKNGDVRLRTILRAWLALDKDSPYLLCTRHWLEQAGIVDLSHSNLALHLQELNQKYI